MKIILSLFILLLSTSLFANYIPYVKSIEQEVIEDPRGGKNKRFEGCGPVAAAMLFSYWEGERNFKIMREDQIFDGSYHPRQTIREFYISSWTQKAIVGSKGPDGKKYLQSFTLPRTLYNGLKQFVKNANKNNIRKLGVRRLGVITSLRKRMRILKKLIKENKPVISLIHNIPACLSSKDNKSGGWHYVVVVGVDDESKIVDILSGWRELDASRSTDTTIHRRRNEPNSNKGHVKCRLDEFRKANPTLFWIEEDLNNDFENL